jgi:signal transduction histidine kinase
MSIVRALIPSSIEIELSMRPSVGPIVGNSNEIQKLADPGAGMDSPITEGIFNHFTRREVGKGMGLGLSVVQGIVLKREGEIVVPSELDVGSTVDVYFPLRDV